MGNGSEARVIEPVELIEMVRSEAEKILDGYGGVGVIVQSET